DDDDDDWWDDDWWNNGGGGGDGGSGNDSGGGGSGGGNSGGGGVVRTNPGNGNNGGGGNNSQQSQTDKNPAAYNWRLKLSNGAFEDHLELIAAKYIYDSDGNLVGNPDAYNCHYHTLSGKDTSAIIGTL